MGSTARAKRTISSKVEPAGGKRSADGKASGGRGSGTMNCDPPCVSIADKASSAAGNFSFAAQKEAPTESVGAAIDAGQDGETEIQVEMTRFIALTLLFGSTLMGQTMQDFTRIYDAYLAAVKKGTFREVSAFFTFWNLRYFRI